MELELELDLGAPSSPSPLSGVEFDEDHAILDRNLLAALHLVLLAALKLDGAAFVARRIDLGLRLDLELRAVASDLHRDGVRVGIGVGDGESFRRNGEKHA